MTRDRNATLDQFGSEGAGDAGNVEGADPDPDAETGAEAEEAAETEGEPGSSGDSDPELDPDSDSNPESETESGSGATPASASASEAGAGATPAEPTCRWTPGGASCSDCGERVERLWRAAGERSGAFVCESCKDWERG